MFIKSLHLKNILSFKDTELELQPLNVLIGANGSGKSNLIDVIALLQAIPNDLAGFLRRNGPTGDWVWNGPGQEEMLFDPAEIKATFGTLSSEYELKIFVDNDRVSSLAENLGVVSTESGGKKFVRPVLRASGGRVNLWSVPPFNIDTNLDSTAVKTEIGRDKSALSEIRAPEEYPLLTVTARGFSEIKVYRNWYVGRNSAVRRPQPTDGDPNFLEEDFSNLALVVNDLLGRRLEPSLNDYLKRFYETYESLHPRIFGNTIELIVNETGMSGALPASRLSDGSIRFIALLAILCHPEPPPLICIEEPEIAMHPDSLGLIAELLVKASERTQIIVTTHSPELAGLIAVEPDCVVACDRDAATGTRFRRITLKELRDWQDFYQQTGKELVVYGMGEMWLSGSIGGVR